MKLARLDGSVFDRLTSTRTIPKNQGFDGSSEVCYTLSNREIPRLELVYDERENRFLSDVDDYDLSPTT
jgi:hypothetical protein